MPNYLCEACNDTGRFCYVCGKTAYRCLCGPDAELDICDVCGGMNEDGDSIFTDDGEDDYRDDNEW